MITLDSDLASQEPWEKSSDTEGSTLLGQEVRLSPRLSSLKSHLHMIALYTSNLIFLAIIGILSIRLRKLSSFDPSIQIYSPANSAVEWIPEQKFRAALFNNTPYMGYPTDEIDARWSALYDFGISKISAQEAARLPNPTLPITGTKESNEYVIELDVWHELHCLNDLRKILYPERFGGLDALKDENGTIQRDDDTFRHWDHCIDSLRQTIMCHADVAPIPFHVNVPVSKGIFPRLATTHTCRNFTKIQEWARDRTIGEWEFSLTKEKAQSVIKSAGFDQSPDEDIEFLYPKFPGVSWFKYWKSHPKEAEAERQRLGTDEFGQLVDE
ncbi:hypothetical protein MBLNU13_g08855t1 [Cladosporium sp. NU13]